ncbi:unnamed protein product, partial [Iphiclides podalirius]
MRGCGCCHSVKTTPVLLFHGLLLTSDSWLDAGPESGLPYLLSRSCYDVWLGNQRGSYRGRRHINLNSDMDMAFWNFYADEIGRYDIPATVDYILKATRTDLLNYIGYSQGGTAFLIMCSEKPEYKHKIGFSLLLAPASRAKYIRSEVFKILCTGVKELETHLYKSGIYEIMTKDGFGRVVASLCKDTYAAETICGDALGLLDGYPIKSMSARTLRVMFNNFPSGTSVRNLVWYGQLVTNGTFRKFNYGDEENVRRYGTILPPTYNVSAVTVPTIVMYGKSDSLVDSRDIKWLVDRLPNLIECVEVNDPRWNHLDFAYSRHIRRTIFSTIDQFLRYYDRGQGTEN